MPIERLRQLVSDRLGIEVPRRDTDSLRETVTDRCRELNLSGADAYLHFVDTQSLAAKREWDELATRLTTGETFFFRDAGHIRLLKHRILPDLIDRRRDVRSIRIWSAGCSSGEEPYSLAILLDELLSDRHRWDISILATDINVEALAKAQRGRYTEWSFRRTEPKLRHRYFQRDRDTWEIDDQIRSMVTFRPLNLLQNSIPGPHVRDMDLIVCRNVFIYFSRASVASAVAGMSGALADDGYLLTAHAELQGLQLPQLKLEVFPDGIVHRKEHLDSEKPAPMVKTTVPADVPAIERARLPQRSTWNPEEISAVHDTHRLAETDEQDLQALMALVRSRANVGDHDQAMECCYQAIQLAPLEAAPHYLLAHILEETDCYEKAVVLLRKVLYLDPGHVGAHLDLAEVCDREGDDAQAQRLRLAAGQLLAKMPDDTAIEYHGSVGAGQLARQIDELVQRG